MRLLALAYVCVKVCELPLAVNEDGLRKMFTSCIILKTCLGLSKTSYCKALHVKPKFSLFVYISVSRTITTRTQFMKLNWRYFHFGLKHKNLLVMNN